MALRTETKKFLLLFYMKTRVSLPNYTSLYQSPFFGFQHFRLWETFCHLVNSFSVDYIRCIYFRLILIVSLLGTGMMSLYLI